MIDLHTHSTASDGSYSPADLVGLAARIGLAGLALTDHDTVDGLAEAGEAAAALGVPFLAGVELSARSDRGTLHIVGLRVDPESPDLLETLAWARARRDERNPRIAERLADLGMPVDLEEVSRAAGGGVIGRPHFAAVMIRKGWAADERDAFERFLGEGGAAYVTKERLEPARCIEAIRAAGGVPVLAHPEQTSREGRDLEDFVRDLVDLGLAGIEVFCSGHTSQRIQDLGRIAKRLGLVRSGGSDFHGASKPAVRLGRGYGSLYVPDHIFGEIESAARRIREETR